MCCAALCARPQLKCGILIKKIFKCKVERLLSITDNDILRQHFLLNPWPLTVLYRCTADEIYWIYFLLSLQSFYGEPSSTLTLWSFFLLQLAMTEN